MLNKFINNLNLTPLNVITIVLAVIYLIYLTYLKSEVRKKRYLVEQKVLSEEKYLQYLSFTNKIKLVIAVTLITLSYFIFRSQ